MLFIKISSTIATTTTAFPLYLDLVLTNSKQLTPWQPPLISVSGDWHVEFFCNKNWNWHFPKNFVFTDSLILITVSFFQ